jgi:hypothetical protein
MKKTANKKGGKSRLKRVLDEDGRKLKWLSESTGINYQRLQRITNQGYEPTLSEAVRLAQALRRSLQDLFPSLDLTGTQISSTGGGSQILSGTRSTKRR